MQAISESLLKWFFCPWWVITAFRYECVNDCATMSSCSKLSHIFFTLFSTPLSIWTLGFGTKKKGKEMSKNYAPWAQIKFLIVFFLLSLLWLFVQKHWTQIDSWNNSLSSQMMSWQVDSLIIILVHKGKMQLILKMMGQECHTKMPFRKLWKAIGV